MQTQKPCKNKSHTTDIFFSKRRCSGVGRRTQNGRQKNSKRQDKRQLQEHFFTMAGLIGSPPYGMKAVRQMRAKNTTSSAPTPSARLRMKKERTYTYFLEKVDPILGDCITHLLLTQPQDVPQGMIEFLQAFKLKKDLENPLIGGNAKPRKELKVFLATAIGPVVGKLVNRLAVMQPEEVIDFMVKELESIKVEDAILPETKPVVKAPETYLKSEPKTIQIAILGINNSGKTSLINTLQGKYDEKIRPTIGFRPSSMMLSEDVLIRFFDLGGGKKIRDIWNQYYHDVHGIIYVVDSSLPDDEFHETIEVFNSTLNNKFLLGKPLLIFANKQDIQGAKPASYLQEILPLHESYADHLFIAETSSLIPDEVPEAFAGDPNIESAVEMLCKRILNQFDTLQTRVNADSQAKAAEEARKRIEREKRVLKGKIAQAFHSVLNPDIIQSLQVEPDEANIFDAEEGLNFLASEIGEEAANLQPLAIKVAAMVGYQRLALQIVGALKAPISKKKVPMNWNEIFDVVSELRKELLLPEL